MKSIFIPKTRVRQPTMFVGVNRSNPLTRNLVFLAYPVGNAWVDVVSGQITPHPSSLKSRCTIDGNQAPATSGVAASAAGGNFPNQTGLDTITSVHSIFGEGSVEVNSTSSPLVRSFESVNGYGLGLHMDDLSLVTNGLYYWANNGNRTNSNTDALGTSSELYAHRFMLTNDGTNSVYYTKGVLNRTTATAILPTAHANRRTTMLGSNGTQQQSSGALVAAWDRVLTLEEYQALYFNPWQLLSSVQTRIWLGTVAGGGSVYQPYYFQHIAGMGV